MGHGEINSDCKLLWQDIPSQAFPTAKALAGVFVVHRIYLSLVG